MRLSSYIASVCLSLAALSSAGSASAQAVSLQVDQSQLLRFDRPVTGVVVGNAGIADVIVHDPKTLFVIGKSSGTTHVMAVDAQGRSVFSGMVSVKPAEMAGLVTIQRGKELSTSLCRDRCIPFVHSEAGSAGISTAAGAATARSAFAKGGN